MKWLFRKSKWIHKYIGLLLILFAVWMSISGILLNHPEIIGGISVPKWMLPPQYEIKNWNRSSLITLQFTEQNPSVGYAAGKMGVWKTEDGGHTFSSFNEGLPASDYYNKTYSLLIREDHHDILAGTEGGLYHRKLQSGPWKRLDLGDKKEPIKKIIRTESNIIVFSDSNIYSSPDSYTSNSFVQHDVKRDSAAPRAVSLVRLFFDLHGGKAWGLIGQLIFDLTGLVIIFLSVTAFYIWFSPWRNKRRSRKAKPPNQKKNKLYKFFSEHHNKWGIWFGLILILISFTAIFMRPPLLAIIAKGDIPASLYPGIERPGDWDKKIRNALYDEDNGKIVIAAEDGTWIGDANLRSPFEKFEIQTPVFVMGATVFENPGKNEYLIGSFSGIFREKTNPGETIDLLTGQVPDKISSVRPSEVMVTGYFRTPDGEEFVTSHEKGLIPLGNARTMGRFRMPDDLTGKSNMSLWNFLFEIHNGRIFKDFIGNWYILFIPIASILFFLVIVSGIYDWFYITFSKRGLKKANGKS